jgi:hypothetical protein
MQYNYFTFAQQREVSKRETNLEYTRWLRDAKYLKPLDIPIIEDQENQFQVT